MTRVSHPLLKLLVGLVFVGCKCNTHVILLRSLDATLIGTCFLAARNIWGIEYDLI